MFKQALRNNDLYVYAIVIFLIAGFLLHGEARSRVLSYTPPQTETALAAAVVEAIPEEEPEVILETTSVPPPVLQNSNATVSQTEDPVDVEDIIDVPVDTVSEDSRVEEVTLPILYTIFREGKDWGEGYGTYSFVDENLVIGGGAVDTASLVLLSNSASFTDYQFSTILDWHRGGAFSLVVRFSDYGNFVTCSFLTSASQVSIISTVNGKRIHEAASPALSVNRFEPWKDLSLGIRIVETTVECLRNGEVVLSKEISTLPEQGGVGLAIWGKNPGEALAQIKEVRISEAF